MAKPANYPKPDLSRLSSRQMQIPPYRGALEGELYTWMCDIVRQTKQPPTDDGARPEVYLMSTAQESIDVLLQAAPLAKSMSLGGSHNGKQTVHATFHWLRTPEGRWILDQVCFGLAENAAATQLARQRAEKLALLDKAELRSESHINLRKAAFPLEDMPLKDYSLNLQLGSDLIQYAIERAHDNAKEDAKMLENPVTPADMALDMLTLGVHAGKPGEMFKTKQLDEAAEGLKGEGREIFSVLTSDPVAARGAAAARNMANAEKLDKAREFLDHSKSVKDDIHTLHEKEKSKGDKALEIGLDLSGAIPCPFIKTIAGMMFDIAISSDAARVTKLRSRCYVFFVAGYINQLALTDTGVPPRKLDKKYFDLGVATAPKPGSPGSLRTQISLMHYASEHYTEGGWKGLGYRKQNWHFPDQYMIKWSPVLLGQAMATQLHKRRYLIE
jgi:hypothetical protein